jgi:multicomponent Na+:H+ antiporter subunit D
MIGEVSPGLILILGALLVPLLKGVVRSTYMLTLPVLAFAQLVALPYGDLGQFSVLGLPLVTLRVDRLSTIFGYIFLIASFLGILYTLYHDDVVQHVAGLVYAGSAVGAVFAGDLVTLFLYWEGTAIASVFLIWASRTERSFDAGMRYLIIQIGSGVLLLAGTLIHFHATQSIAFNTLGLVSTGTWLIFLAFGIKCAFPLLHNWLQDSYPEATPGGTVMLSAFTTKLAVYALARGYAGTEILVPIGATMTAFPIVYAVIENDLRRVLAYSLNSQLGFMVVGIGIGSELAINGTVAHAFCSILYKALLLMSMGAVLLRVGTVKGSELGGLYKSMPWTTAFCAVGAASISAFPLFSGFVSKSMIIAAALENGYLWAWLVLLLGSTGAFLHSGIKIPYFAFFAHDSGKRCAEAPASMLVAMALTALLCIGIGVWPAPLYAILPFKVDFVPYTVEHVVTQMQLLMFSALAFTFLMRTGLYPPELRSVNLDSDWFYRKAGQAFLNGVNGGSAELWSRLVNGIHNGSARANDRLRRYLGPDGTFGRAAPTGAMAFWTTLLLGAFLIISAL